MNPVTDRVKQRYLVSECVDRTKAALDRVDQRNPVSDDVDRKNLGFQTELNKSDSDQVDQKTGFRLSGAKKP